MSEDNTSYLRFSLEESVWFERGQEVGELYSVSLEPNVSIHEIEQYVVLRGTLELVGEYKPDSAGDRQEDFNAPYQKYVSVTEQRDTGHFEFFHQFPVDITVPAERVQSLDELNIGVQSFDCKMPERGCLHIMADLWITGIYDEVGPSAPENQFEVVSTFPLAQESTSFLRNEESTYDGQADNEDDVQFYNEVEDEQSDRREVFKQEEYEHEEYDQEDIVEVPLYRSVMEAEVEELPVEMQFESEEESYMTVGPLTKVNLFDETEKNETFYAEAKLQPREDEQTHELFSSDKYNSMPHGQHTLPFKEEYRPAPAETPVVEQPKNETRSKSLLMDLFSDKQEGIQGRMKVCIVQTGETIEEVAQRYNTTAQHIAKANKLELDRDIAEGQVLYIPR